jgi:hypothetical protein
VQSLLAASRQEQQLPFALEQLPFALEQATLRALAPLQV